MELAELTRATALIAAAEEPVAASDGDTAARALGLEVVDVEPTVVAVAHQCRPVRAAFRIFSSPSSR